MKIRDLYVLNEINRQDLNNSQWGVYQFLQPRKYKGVFRYGREFHAARRCMACGVDRKRRAGTFRAP